MTGGKVCGKKNKLLWSLCSNCGYYLKDCHGCAEIEGRAFWLEYTEENICGIYDCCLNERKYAHSEQCEELPCSRFEGDDPTKSPEEYASDYGSQMKNLNEYRQIENLVEDLYQKVSTFAKMMNPALFWNMT